MEDNQKLLNTIYTLASVIDPLIRAEKKDAIDKVVEKILETIEKIK
jgi:hypothetical protein